MAQLLGESAHLFSSHKGLLPKSKDTAGSLGRDEERRNSIMTPGRRSSQSLDSKALLPERR
jgi:hypothetical protein